MKDLLSIYIPTINEEINLPQCLASASKLGATIYVVDSNSADRTIEIAKEAGCVVVTGNWRTFSEKMNWAISELPIRTPWTLRIDADEWLTDELILELKAKLPVTPEEVGAYSINRRVYFLNRWIRHGGMYPLWGVRLWRTGRAKCEVRELDEHMEVTGRIVNLQHDIVDEGQRGLSHWVQKHNQYADAEVREILRVQQPEGSSNTLIHQAAKKRWLKVNLYYRLPMFWRALFFWIYRYFFKFGFLDGIPGLIYHTLHGFWFRFLVDSKLYEVKTTNKNAQGIGSR
ncbi:glycosyl transferase family 2 [mine drainage metagenome]|uniref:Glycosyl transferase family 2 n=1 Tax=mine drainage metagenome TaxID=410659 RepID=A0A1J5TGB7_9ZZZZ